MTLRCGRRKANHAPREPRADVEDMRVTSSSGVQGVASVVFVIATYLVVVGSNWLNEQLAHGRACDVLRLVPRLARRCRGPIWRLARSWQRLIAWFARRPPRLFEGSAGAWKSVCYFLGDFVFPVLALLFLYTRIARGVDKLRSLIVIGSSHNSWSLAYWLIHLALAVVFCFWAFIQPRSPRDWTFIPRRSAQAYPYLAIAVAALPAAVITKLLLLAGTVAAITFLLLLPARLGEVRLWAGAHKMASVSLAVGFGGVFVLPLVSFSASGGLGLAAIIAAGTFGAISAALFEYAFPVPKARLVVRFGVGDGSTRIGSSHVARKPCPRCNARFERSLANPAGRCRNKVLPETGRCAAGHVPRRW